MKDFAYCFLPFGGLLAALLIFVPTRRVHRGCVSLCCLHLQLGPLRIGIAASICLYSLIRLSFTVIKLREVYAAAAKPETAAALAAAGMPGNVGAVVKGSSSYQLRHERNLWIELFCLVLWLFVWRCGKLLGKQWQCIDALNAEVVLLKRNLEESSASETRPKSSENASKEGGKEAVICREADTTTHANLPAASHCLAVYAANASAQGQRQHRNDAPEETRGDGGCGMND
ncbi:uncharacterized protein LOC34617571 [Cyclospora cayetanensis]|uniref:Uncharacterized protein LOC34617571 n=1 Tax=Cyclospora cayetanensis TaxID=88456 RepID=A0A6P6RYG8_9EIME|nr:uncharacterized protein LOC34617571 [Cyclospora cayetanensis]